MTSDTTYTQQCIGVKNEGNSHIPIVSSSNFFQNNSPNSFPNLISQNSDAVLPVVEGPSNGNLGMDINNPETGNGTANNIVNPAPETGDASSGSSLDSDPSESETENMVVLQTERNFYENIDLISLFFTKMTTCAHHLSREQYNNVKDFIHLLFHPNNRLPSYSTIQRRFRRDLLDNYCVPSRRKQFTLDLDKNGALTNALLRNGIPVTVVQYSLPSFFASIRFTSLIRDNHRLVY